MRLTITAALALLAGLGCQPEKRACTKLCETLILTCGYEAYPTFASCDVGCEYDVAAGADVEGQLACVEAAAQPQEAADSGEDPPTCDTFAIIECARTYGAAANGDEEEEDESDA